MGKRPNYITMIFIDFPMYAGPFSSGLSQPWCPGSRELQTGGCIKIGRARKGRNTLGLPKEFGPWIPVLSPNVRHPQEQRCSRFILESKIWVATFVPASGDLGLKITLILVSESISLIVDPSAAKWQHQGPPSQSRDIPSNIHLTGPGRGITTYT